MFGRSLAPVLVLLVVALGCSDGTRSEDADEPVATSREGIVGGHADPGDPGAVLVLWEGAGTGFSACTGSLLAPNTVLTAQHCVARVVEGPEGFDCATTSFSVPDVAGNFLVSTKAQSSMNLNDYHRVSEVVVPPQAGESRVCGDDLAVLILADDVAATEAVALAPRVDTPVAAGEQYSAIGFGSTGDTSDDSDLRRRLDGLTVDCVGAACAGTDANSLETSDEFIGDRGICLGDSGGPAVDAQNRVFGVASRGASGCGSPIYGDVQSHADWIKQTARHSANVGGYSPPSWAAGSPADPADTASGKPVDGERVASARSASGCSVAGVDPTIHVSWLLPGAMGALLLSRRRRSRPHNDFKYATRSAFWGAVSDR